MRSRSPSSRCSSMPAAVAERFSCHRPRWAVWRLMGIGSGAVLDVAAWVAASTGRCAASAPPGRASTLDGVGVRGAGAAYRKPPGSLSLAVALLATMAAARTSPADVMDRPAGTGRGLARGGWASRHPRPVGSRFTVDRWLAADGDLRKGNDPSLRAGTPCDRMGCVRPSPRRARRGAGAAAEASREDWRPGATGSDALVRPAVLRTGLHSSSTAPGARGIGIRWRLRLEDGRFAITETRRRSLETVVRSWADATAAAVTVEPSQPRRPAPDDGSDLRTP